MNEYNEAILGLVFVFIIALIGFWFIFFAPCWVYTWTTPISRCVKYFTK